MYTKRTRYIKSIGYNDNPRGFEAGRMCPGPSPECYDQAENQKENDYGRAISE